MSYAKSWDIGRSTEEKCQSNFIVITTARLHSLNPNLCTYCFIREVTRMTTSFTTVSSCQKREGMNYKTRVLTRTAK